MKAKGPIRAIYYPHKAIRAELRAIQDLAERQNTKTYLTYMEPKVIFLADVVNAHAKGEEEVFYPAVDELRREMSGSFRWDHEIDEKHFQNIKECIARIKSGATESEINNLKRNVYALNAVLSAHAQKEDDLLVPLVDREISPQKQGEMVGRIVAHLPPDLTERMLKWIIWTISPEERVDFIGIVREGAPPDRFSMMKRWVRVVVPEEEWRELLDRMPALGQ